MIRGRAEALQEASGDHRRRQKALAPGGVRARTFCLQIAGYAPGGLYRNYFAPTEDSRVRIGPAGPHLLDLVACTVGANSRPMARPLYAAPCHAPQPTTVRTITAGRPAQNNPIWALASHPRPGSQYRSDRRVRVRSVVLASALAVRRR